MSRLQLVHKGPRHENKAHEDFSLAVEPAASEEINFPPTSEDKALARHKPSLRGLERKKGKKNKKRNGSSKQFIPNALLVFVSPTKKCSTELKSRATRPKREHSGTDCHR